MSFLISIAMIIVGGVTSAMFPNFVSFLMVFAGAFSLGSFSDKEVVYDYVIADSDEVLLRVRSYYYITILNIAFMIITLGLLQFKIRILWKEEYYKGNSEQFEENREGCKLSRKEYIALINEQRRIYSTTDLSWEFMNGAYSPEEFDLKGKKRKFVIISVIAGILLCGLTVPADIILVVCFEA